MTQVSLAPPFCDELTTSAPSSKATRVSPPGSTPAASSGKEVADAASGKDD